MYNNAIFVGFIHTFDPELYIVSYVSFNFLIKTVWKQNTNIESLETKDMEF